jgi:hypothetical protein
MKTMFGWRASAVQAAAAFSNNAVAMKFRM